MQVAPDTGANGLDSRLEAGGLIVLAGEPFRLAPDEFDLLSPSLSDGRAKNVSLSPDGVVRGAAAGDGRRPRLTALMERYRGWATGAVTAAAPRYAEGLAPGRTSLRLREVSDGPLSPRKDDRRLHVDAFASLPTGGRRILRVFTNINPDGEARLWRVGEPFEAYARRWVARVRRPWPGEARLLHLLGVTRARRTAYDALMLGLHDAAKLDDAYQAAAPGREVSFPAGASWLVFTDCVVHAALRGRCMLEQTFTPPLSAMARPDLAPQSVLERLTGRTLG